MKTEANRADRFKRPFNLINECPRPLQNPHISNKNNEHIQRKQPKHFKIRVRMLEPNSFNNYNSRRLCNINTNTISSRKTIRFKSIRLIQILYFIRLRVRNSRFCYKNNHKKQFRMRKAKKPVQSA